MNRTTALPLVCACSGCSSDAQLANAVARKLDRVGVARMSCIAGLGGDVPSLVRTAKSGRPIVAIDGCVLACVPSTLARHGIEPTQYLYLPDQGVRKRHHADFDLLQAQRVLNTLSARIPRAATQRRSDERARPKLKMIEGAC